MRALIAKFSIPTLRNILLGTGDSILVENSPYDDYWGNKGVGIGTSQGDVSSGGRNMLGEELMILRTAILNGTDPMNALLVKYPKQVQAVQQPIAAFPQHPPTAAFPQRPPVPQHIELRARTLIQQVPFACRDAYYDGYLQCYDDMTLKIFAQYQQYQQ